MTNYWIEMQTGRPLTLAMSPPGAGVGNQPRLPFDTQPLLDAYLRDKLQLPEDAIRSALEKGAVIAPVSASAAERCWKDLELRTHG